MPGIKRWTGHDVVKGVWTIKLSSWKHFYEYVRAEMLDYNHYVWRGDRMDTRPLLPSFDRLYLGKDKKIIEAKLKEHLDNFTLSVRGRRGPNPSRIENENDWWALGQHHGLSTPLLDWTKSPFVALFFAFEKNKKPQTSNRVIYAVSPSTCTSRSNTIKSAHVGLDRPDIVEFLTPFQDENYRLVNQNGLFSRCTAGKAIDKWVTEQYADNSKSGIMIKIIIPDRGREECLRTLNKMNINHLTLFPDLYGASNFCNFTNTIEKY